jgi:hypothetical protein
MVCLLAGGVVGGLLYLVGAWSTPESTAYVETPEFLIYVSLVAAQIALWLIGVSVFFSIVSALPTGTGAVKSSSVLVAGVLFAVALVVPIVTVFLYPNALEFDSPLYRHTLRGVFLGLLGSTVAVAGGLTLAAISAAARDAAGNDAQRLDAYVSRRDELQRVLFFLGAMIGAATLALGAQRHAFVEHGVVSADDFPPELVLAYGAYYSLLLAAAYVPVYVNVVALGRDVLDRLLGRWPPNLRDGKAWGEWISQRDAAELFLQLRTTPVQRLQTALAVLAPLAGSAVSLVLGVNG